MVKVDSRGHMGAALSLFEILRVLYDDVMRFDPKKIRAGRSATVASSARACCIALYSLLADKGFFPAEEFDRFCRKDSILGVIRNMAKCRG